MNYKKLLYYWEGPIAIPTGKMYMHSGGTDVIWVLSLQQHTPPVHWAQCTQPCERMQYKRLLRYMVEIGGVEIGRVKW